MRMYPNAQQAQSAMQTIGSARFVYNHYLALRIDAYQQQGITLRYEDCANQLHALKNNTNGSKKWTQQRCSPP
jgi:putative transposase